MKPIIFNCGIPDRLYDGIVRSLAAESGTITQRSFPDDETYLRIETDCHHRQVMFACSLDRPNPKVLPLILAAETARDLGASRIGLIAPYLAYMRQDKRFKTGEGVTARYFASLISTHFDYLMTVDPHLHRFNSLDDIYSIPSKVIHASDRIGHWILENIDQPLLIGPDMESEQWVNDVANQVGAPYVILEKVRLGDRQVSVSVPDIEAHSTRVPVLIDDIISSGQTMIEAVKQLAKLNTHKPLCITVHPISADHAVEQILEAGCSRVVSCNTIHDKTNAIDLSALFAKPCRELLGL